MCLLFLMFYFFTYGNEIIATVEPLTNDHPHQRPSLSYDHISCDGQWFLFVYESLTSDNPSYMTRPMWFWGWSYKRGSTVIAISWLMCRQWWRGCKGNIFGSIQHQSTELTQLGHIWPISPTCNSNFTVSTCRLHNLAIHKWLFLTFEWIVVIHLV